MASPAVQIGHDAHAAVRVPGAVQRARIFPLPARRHALQSLETCHLHTPKESAHDLQETPGILCALPRRESISVSGVGSCALPRRLTRRWQKATRHGRTLRTTAYRGDPALDSDTAGMSDRRQKAHALGGAAGVLLVAAGVALVLPLAVIGSLAAAGVQLTPALVITLSILLTQGLSFGGVALLYLALQEGTLRVPVRWPTAIDVNWMVGGSALALAALIVGWLVVSLVGLDVGEHQLQEAGMADPQIFLLLIVLSLLLIGPAEELLFRGVVQGRLRQAFGAGAAIGLAAVTFAALHMLALSGPLAARITTVVVLVLPSLVFGIAYERTGNIAVPAVIHGVYNATLLAVSYYAVQTEAAA
ncbi:MAG: CPBP family intramembrane metalloprotease [Thioalkalivibrio sp.]|nr:MAG: CPBP family intramembrane metalloprotease [Thioalkalivibrio sp.]